ncbi:hypothetical protein F0562_002800 [Nyssa sinensis]|uniref:RNase H type-1 domain-containing protein n=1 Tax=Nyssa sinensis TaxID=561372 RepID=A0A5J5BYW0_9ASTE|nr:hypothetical protein F0562_002800 [Nyssa sinensis]
MNFDGALFPDLGAVGFGVVVRDYGGNFIDFTLMKLATAALNAISFALGIGLNAITLKRDSLRTINGISSSSEDSLHLAYVNSVAHSLARYGQNVDDLVEWLQEALTR